MTEHDSSQAGKAPTTGETRVTVAGRISTPAEEAILEYGRRLVLESPATGLDFHRSMLAVSATFGSLLTTLAPLLIGLEAEVAFGSAEGWLLVLPLGLMLVSSVVFAVGSLPSHAEVNINIVEEVSNERKRVLRLRRRLAGLGMLVFSASLLLTVVLALAMGPR